MSKYNELMSQEWDKHKIDNRLDRILMDIKKEDPTDLLVRQLNNLDTQLMEIMRYSEKNCNTISRHCIDPWSPKLKELSREIRYLIVQIKHTIRDKLSLSVVDYMTQVNALNEKLKTKRNGYRTFIKQAAAHREIHLDERAQHHILLGKNRSVASENKRLKNIEIQNARSSMSLIMNDVIPRLTF